MEAENPKPGPDAPGRASGPPAPQLTPETLDVLGGVFYQFRVALANLQLYAAGSQQAVKACNGMYDVLASFLEKHKSLAISDAADALMANGAQMQLSGTQKGAADYFQRVMRRAGIKSLTFKLGIAIEELYRFLDWLHQRHLDKDGAEAGPRDAGALAREEFGNISFNERVFVSVGDDDLVLRGGGSKLGGMGGGVEEVMKEVQKLMDLTDIEDPAVRDRVRLEVARQLVQSDPGLLAKLHEAGGAAREAPAQEDQAGNLVVPGDLLREVAAEMAGVYRELSESADPSSPLGAAVAGLKRSITRLLAMASGTAELGRIYQDMVESGGAHLLQGGEAGAAAPAQAPESVAEEVIALDSLQLLDEGLQARLPGLVASLDLAQRPDLTEKLLERFAENLAASTLSVRRKAAAGVKGLLAAAKRTSRPGVAEKLDPALLGA